MVLHADTTDNQDGRVAQGVHGCDNPSCSEKELDATPVEQKNSYSWITSKKTILYEQQIPRITKKTQKATIASWAELSRIMKTHGPTESPHPGDQ